MFTAIEVGALVAGLRLLKAWGGGALAAAADPALEKLVATLPPARRHAAQQSRVFAPEFVNLPQVRDAFDVVHGAMNAQRLLRLPGLHRRATARHRPHRAAAGPVLLGQ